MKRALLIYNPAAGGWRDRGEGARRIARRLEGAGLEVALAPTAAPGHAEELARQAAAERLDVVFSFGGDGTLRECAAGLLGSRIPLGFLPGGTANVMTRVLGVPRNPLRAAELLVGGHRVALDVALCNGRVLLMQASVGLDAQVLARLDPRRKRWLGKAEVALGFVSAWWSFTYPAFDVDFGDQHRSVTFAAVCNIPFYGGSWRIAPAARWDDGQLDLVLFSGHGRRATLGFARDLLLGRHHRRPDVEIVRTRQVEIGAAEGLRLQLDGDSFADALPASIQLSSERLDFLVPSPGRPIRSS